MCAQFSKIFLHIAGDTKAHGRNVLQTSGRMWLSSAVASVEYSCLFVARVEAFLLIKPG